MAQVESSLCFPPFARTGQAKDSVSLLIRVLQGL